jgi:imidazolonepropionase-like amidohydrolase
MRTLSLFLVFAAALAAQTFAIRGARVVDGRGGAVAVETVVVRDGRIVAVGADAAIPDGVRAIDGSGLTLLPGLFDLHTHLRASAAPAGHTVAADWAKNLAAYLAVGVTSVDDFGNYGEQFEPMRRLLASGAVRGPRVHLAARISPPEGHGTEGGQGDLFTLEAATPEQAHAVMRTALAWHPDVIKVFTDGWRYGTAPALASMNEETIAAIVEDAHQAGIKVLTHTVSLENARITVRAGVDSLVHGIGDRDVDDDFLALIRQKGTAYVSTLSVYEPRNRTELFPGLDGLLEPPLRKLMGHTGSAPQPNERWSHLVHNLGKLYAAGVPVGNGTDAGMPGTYHGWAALHEMELGTLAGLTPLQAITAATQTSARILGIDRDLGTIEPGKLADLVLIDGKPDERIADIYRTVRVFLGGQEVDLASLRAAIAADGPYPIPARPVGALLDDFERSDGRTALGTLPIYGTDPGIDHSKVLFTRIARTAADHALTIQARMGPKEQNYVRLLVPLTPGAIEPADLSAYQGISLDVRGEGSYRLRLDTHGADFDAGAEWKTVRIGFAAMEGWKSRYARQVEIELAGPAGAPRWLEIDNLRFY